MAYDEEVAHRIREATTGIQLTEKKMFGGLAFLFQGNMAVAASGGGQMMVRADPAEVEAHVADGAERMVMKGKSMNGWLLVRCADLPDERFTKWVEVGLTFARSLPAK